MSQLTNEIEDDVLCTDQTGSWLNGEGNGGSDGGTVLKKGPWTSSEDAILVDYVRKHGEGNWNAVQKHSGLSRCGKSCRLRWANHLRPNLRKGAFTAEEEQLIAELHSKMGNKWARMAAHLPGRTDNEIKNYWNTRIKRRQRAGLPLYPSEVCSRTFQESQCGQGTGGINDGDGGNHDFLPESTYEIHDATFDYLKEKGILPIVPDLPDISANNSPPYCNFLPLPLPLPLPNHNHLQESTMSFLGSSGMDQNWFGHVQDHTSDNIAKSFGLYSPLDPSSSLHNSIFYRHSLSNGNSSTSKPTSKAVKSELPSLQYPETNFGSWGTCPPPLLNESVDVFIQSPLPHSVLESGCSSPHNSGLLESLIYQATTTVCSKNNCSDKSSNSSTATPVDIAESSALNMHETEQEDYADPASPFGATSILNLNEYHATNTNGNSWGNTVKYESVDQVCAPNGENHDMAVLNITWPDLLLASDWHEHMSSQEPNLHD